MSHCIYGHSVIVGSVEFRLTWVAKTRDQSKQKKKCPEVPDDDAAKTNAITTSSHVIRCFLFRTTIPRVAPCRRSRAIIEPRHRTRLGISSLPRPRFPGSTSIAPLSQFNFSTIFREVPPGASRCSMIRSGNTAWNCMPRNTSLR